MLLRRTLLYLPAQVVGPLAQFISIILWTHYLSPAEMGVFALVVAAQEFAYTFTLFWFTIYTMRYFDAASDDGGSFLRTERTVMLGASLATALSMALLPLFVSAEWNVSLIAATLFYSVSRTIASHLADRARASHDAISYSLLQIAWPIIGFVLALIFVETWEQTAAAVLWGYAAGQIIALAAAAPRLGFGRGPGHSRDIAAAAMRYGAPLVAGALFIWLANNGIRFLIEARDGAAAVGLVTVGWGLGLRVASFAAMLVTAAAFPLAMARSREDGIDAGQAQLVRNGVLLLVVLAPAAAGLWAISTPLVEWLVAQPFQAVTADILPWAILAGVARNLRIHCGEQVFLLREEPVIPLINDLIDAVLTMAAAAAGLIWFGVHGCVIGAALASVATLFITIFYANWRHDFTMPPSDLVRIGLATATMAAVVQAAPVSADALAIFGAIALGATVYVITLSVLYPHRALELTKKLRRYAGA